MSALFGVPALKCRGAVLALTALPGLCRTRRIAPVIALQGALAAAVLALGAAGLRWPALVPAVARGGSWEAKALMVAAVVAFGTLANRAMRTFALTRRASDLVVSIGCDLARRRVGRHAERGGRQPRLLPRPRPRARRHAAARADGGPRPAPRERVPPARRRPARGGRRFVRGGVRRGAGPRADGPPRRARRRDRGSPAARRAARRPRRRGARPAGGRAASSGGRRAAARHRQAVGGRRDRPHAGRAERRRVRGGQAPPRRGRAAAARARRVRARGPPPRRRAPRAPGRRGYPGGLAAADLAIGPRILAVCDVYDALVSDRVYRAAWTPERAIALLRRDAGTALDAPCVESLARVVGLAPVALPSATTAGAALGAAGAPAIRAA